MRGHIVKRGSSYSIVVELERDPETGKRKQQWVTFKGTKKQAETKLTEMLDDLNKGTFVKPAKTTLAEFLEKWLADYASPNVGPRSLEQYTHIVRRHFTPEIGNIPLTQLKPEHLQRQYASRLKAGLSAGTVRYHHAIIHKALQTAVKWGLVARNVADSVDLPRNRRKEMLTWSEDEIARFLDVSKDSPYYALFHTALFTGMRRSELLALRWQDLDFIFSRIYVTRSVHQLKGGRQVFTQPKSEKSRRTVALSPSAFLVLKDHKQKREAEGAMMGVGLKDDDLVFSNLEGQPLHPDTVTEAWSRAAARAGVKAIRLHDARHTHASLMLKQGVHPKVVQERLGHASISMTLDVYSHVAPGLQEAAAAAFDSLVNREKAPLANG